MLRKKYFYWLVHLREEMHFFWCRRLYNNMKHFIKTHRHLLLAGDSTLPTGGCARYARYQVEAANSVQRTEPRQKGFACITF